MTTVCLTPNGREIRKTETGYEVQPHDDNYWIECRTVAECLYRYHFPRGDHTARRMAQLIIDSWDSQWSIDETSRVGVSEADHDAAAELAGNYSAASAVIAEIEALCRQRASA